MPPRKRRKRSFKIDKTKLAEYVISRLDADLSERETWMGMRLDREAKRRGWLPVKDWPWPGSSNVWAPIMATSSLRVQSAIFNAIMGFRPVITSKALQRRNYKKQDRIDSLLDWQMFVEQDGTSKIDDLAANFVNDGTVFAHIRWNREEQTISDVRILDQPLDPFLEPELQFAPLVDVVVPDGVEVVSKEPIGDGWTWKLVLDDKGVERKARLQFYEREDGKTEVHLHREVVTSDGPAFTVENIEDIVAPIRSANLQPPTGENPHGAPYFSRIGRASLSTIKRRMDTGVYDLLTKDDWDQIKLSRDSINTGVQDERPKEQKDKLLGVQPQYIKQPPSSDDQKEQPSLRPQEMIEWYGAYDLNGDGYDEEVIITVHRQTKRLARARFLTELYPGIPVKRPVAEARFIPVTNQIYGVGLPELIEPLYDIFKTLMDLNLDWGEIRNTPFFFYRAASSIQPEVIRLAPGDGYPLDNPQQDVFFPQWGNTNNVWAFNTMQLVQQEIERLTMVSDVQLGRVPPGKASALRTTGTTMALLQQGDVRAEQVLRRLFVGIKQIFSMFHRLNRVNLPKDKEFRMLGVPKKGEEIYDTASPEQIDADMDFDFRATMFNTNRQVLSQALERLMAVFISPITLQLGLATPDTIYRLMRDYAGAIDQDEDRYLNPPNPESRGPKILAEEALSAISANEVPKGVPLEGALPHLQALIEFENSDDFGSLEPEQLQIYAQYKQQVGQLVQREQQQQQMAQAAQQLQTQLGQQPGGNGAEGAVGQEPELPQNSGGLTPDSGANG